MLRVEVQDSANTMTLVLQGRLVGEEAVSARSLMTRYRAGIRLIVDLSEVSFMDASGEDLLSFFARFGAVFIADTSYSQYICERLRLHVVVRAPSDHDASNPSDTTGMESDRRARRPLVND